MAKNFNSEQQLIINTIRKVVGRHYKGDMTKIIPDSIFYTPEEWNERGEEYGLESKLIVTHDGGEVAPFFNLDYEAYKLYDEMVEAFDATPYWSEGCTCWYSCFYI